MKQRKDIWVEEVLNSTDGMVSANPREGTYAAIQSRLGRELAKGRRIPLGVMSAAVACLLVLFAVNIKVVSGYANTETEETTEETGAVMEDLIEYYELGSNSVGI